MTIETWELELRDTWNFLFLWWLWPLGFALLYHLCSQGLSCLFIILNIIFLVNSNLFIIIYIVYCIKQYVNSDNSTVKLMKHLNIFLFVMFWVNISRYNFWFDFIFLRISYLHIICLTRHILVWFDIITRKNVLVWIVIDTSVTVFFSSSYYLPYAKTFL